MSEQLTIGESRLGLQEVAAFVFASGPRRVRLTDGCRERVVASHARFREKAEGADPIYGVTTGFGDSSNRRILPAQSEELQRNLVRYLTCGTGPELPKEAVRAMVVARLISLSRGYSGVSPELLDRICLLLERDWLPVVPREGSLGASGDLIPLAYLARAVQGEGEVDTPSGRTELASLRQEHGIGPYTLLPKEGLALVNGTSTMTGLAIHNLRELRFLAETGALATSWLCRAMEGRSDAFGELVNEQAKFATGQTQVARWIRQALESESYQTPARPKGDAVQDRYSLRCTPQVLGPVLDTISMAESWVEAELNGVSDNPLIAPDGRMANGGNFYGGYLSQAMDYAKICLGHIADLADRQVALIVDEKTNRGLPANLANWPGLPEDERFLHHGLKGLHQSCSAITSEIMARTMPSGVFSRSAESHNQDKVSLGLSAATAVSDMIEVTRRLQSLQLVCFAQGLDLRGLEVRGEPSKTLFGVVRESVPFVARDRAMDKEIMRLAASLKNMAQEKGRWFE